MNKMEDKEQINITRLSCNERNEKNKKRIKLGIKVSNLIREALLLDAKYKNTLWADTIKRDRDIRQCWCC